MPELSKPMTPTEIAEAIEKLSAIHVSTDREKQLQTTFERLFVLDDGNAIAPRLFSKGLETRGIAVVGEPGSGKTELISEFLCKHQHFNLRAGIEDAACLHITVPSPATLKSVGLELLKALGYVKISDRRERWAIWDLVKHRLSLLGIRVLWIDEAHDLYTCSSVREQEDLLKTLKSLMQGEHAVVVVLSGTKPVSDLMKIDRQVGRRFSKIELPPITYVNDGEALSGLLKGFAERVNLDIQGDDDLVRCLIGAARSQFGLAIEITIGAIEMALLNGHTTLGRQDFVDYWGMQEGGSLEGNVFWTNRCEELLLVEPPTDPQNSSRGRVKK